MEEFVMILRVPVKKVADVLDDLKYKVIADFNKYIKKLSYGYYTDTYKDILNEICLIESYDSIDNNKLIYEYYINNGLY
nr:MAG TPA: hypothetical protein [Bacteriophage sp.]